MAPAVGRYRVGKRIKRAAPKTGRKIRNTVKSQKRGIVKTYKRTASSQKKTGAKARKFVIRVATK